MYEDLYEGENLSQSDIEQQLELYQILHQNIENIAEIERLGKIQATDLRFIIEYLEAKRNIGSSSSLARSIEKLANAVDYFDLPLNETSELSQLLDEHKPLHRVSCSQKDLKEISALAVKIAESSGNNVNKTIEALRKADYAFNCGNDFLQEYDFNEIKNKLARCAEKFGCHSTFESKTFDKVGEHEIPTYHFSIEGNAEKMGEEIARFNEITGVNGLHFDGGKISIEAWNTESVVNILEKLQPKIETSTDKSKYR